MIIRVFLLAFILCFSFFYVNAQKNTTLRWEVSVSSGLFLDFFYLDFSIIGNQGDIGGGPSSYPDKKQSKVQPGKVDRLELKYNLNNKAGLSVNFNYAAWTALYGTGNDPLELWKETRRTFHRIQFVGNYYRNFYPGNKRSHIYAGIGFLIQGEQNTFPYYRVNADDPTNITELSAEDLSYFWDWGIQLSGSYYYQVNRNLKLGVTVYTYFIGTYIDGTGIMGSIAIPFGRKVKK